MNGEPSPSINFGFWLAVVLAVMLGGMLAWIGAHVVLDRLETILPTIVIVGVFALLASLALIAIAFSILGLSDKTQALALPDGSVRAVIALMLVVLFAIISIFLYNSLLSSGAVIAANGLTQAEFDNLENVKKVVIIRSQESRDKDNKSTFNVIYQAPENVTAQDFAKQMLVLLGTLVTAVSSFYFGANSVASAVGAVGTLGSKTTPTQLRLSEAIPRSLKRDGQVTDLRINGDNLGDVNNVTLIKGGDQIAATHVAAKDNQVLCKLKVDASTPEGDWDVVVSDGDGDARLTGYIHIEGSA